MNGEVKAGNFSLKNGQFVDSHPDILSVFYFNFSVLGVIVVFFPLRNIPESM